MGTLERDIEDYLVRECERLGWPIWKIEIIGRRGCPDRMIMPGGGHVFFVELKRPTGGVVSSSQRLRHKELLEAGCTVYIPKTKDAVDWLLSCEKAHLKS